MKELIFKIESIVGLAEWEIPQFVREAGRFKSAIVVTLEGGDGTEADGKKLMDLFLLAAECGARLKRGCPEFS